jgi:hypothetical protein
VQDTTPPVLSNVPANITVEATGPLGAVVTFASPTATDLVDPHPSITATPPSGSTFPLGSTTVTVTATDESGNTTLAHFTVDVQDTTPPVPENVPANMTVTIVAPTPPQVVGIAPVTSRKGATSFLVRFNEALSSVSASDLALYHVFSAVKKRGKTAFARVEAIRSVQLNGDATAVTINLARPVKGRVEVMVKGAITAANGASNSINSSNVGGRTT